MQFAFEKQHGTNATQLPLPSHAWPGPHGVPAGSLFGRHTLPLQVSGLSQSVSAGDPHGVPGAQPSMSGQPTPGKYTPPWLAQFVSVVSMHTQFGRQQAPTTGHVPGAAGQKVVTTGQNVCVHCVSMNGHTVSNCGQYVVMIPQVVGSHGQEVICFGHVVSQAGHDVSWIGQTVTVPSAQ